MAVQIKKSSSLGSSEVEKNIYVQCAHSYIVDPIISYTVTCVINVQDCKFSTVMPVVMVQLLL